MFWLEQTFPLLCSSHQPFLPSIQKLKLTLRRSDWWYNERNAPLSISPYRNNSENANSMLQDMSTSSRGEELLFLPNSWGSAFKHLPSLKSLEIEFETSDDKKDELLSILKWARTWRFPLSEDGVVLSAEGTDVTSMSWQSPMCGWSDICPYCGSHGSCRLMLNAPTAGQQQKEECRLRMKARQLGRGPICHVYSVLWRKVAKEKDARR